MSIFKNKDSSSGYSSISSTWNIHHNYFNWNIWITVCDDSSPVQCSVKSLFALLFVIDTDVWYLDRLVVV